MNRLIYLVICCLFINLSSFAYYEDEFVNKSFMNEKLCKPVVYDNYDYQKTNKIKVKLKITESINSENDLYEGQILKFKIAENVYFDNNLIFKKDDICYARVETVISNGMNGIPASIIIGNFKINGIDVSKISVEYEKFGADLSLLVFPIKWALTPFPPTGSLTNFIKGGHAKFKENQCISIYYYYP